MLIYILCLNWSILLILLQYDDCMNVVIAIIILNNVINASSVYIFIFIFDHDT